MVDMNPVDFIYAKMDIRNLLESIDDRVIPDYDFIVLILSWLPKEYKTKVQEIESQIANLGVKDLRSPRGIAERVRLVPVDPLDVKLASITLDNNGAVSNELKELFKLVLEDRQKSKALNKQDNGQRRVAVTIDSVIKDLFGFYESNRSVWKVDKRVNLDVYLATGDIKYIDNEGKPIVYTSDAKHVTKRCTWCAEQGKGKGRGIGHTVEECRNKARAEANTSHNNNKQSDTKQEFRGECFYCRGNHRIADCPKLQNRDVDSEGTTTNSDKSTNSTKVIPPIKSSVNTVTTTKKKAVGWSCVTDKVHCYVSELADFEEPEETVKFEVDKWMCDLGASVNLTYDVSSLYGTQTFTGHVGGVGVMKFEAIGSFIGTGTTIHGDEIPFRMSRVLYCPDMHCNIWGAAPFRKTPGVELNVSGEFPNITVHGSEDTLPSIYKLYESDANPFLWLKFTPTSEDELTNADVEWIRECELKNIEYCEKLQLEAVNAVKQVFLRKQSNTPQIILTVDDDVISHGNSTSMNDTPQFTSNNITDEAIQQMVDSLILGDAVDNEVDNQ